MWLCAGRSWLVPKAGADAGVCAVVAAVLAGVVVVRRKSESGAGVLLVLRVARERIGDGIAGALQLRNGKVLEFG